MTTSSQAPITSSELANLWMAYQEKTMMLRVLEHFIEHSDPEGKQLLQSHYNGAAKNIEMIKSIFQQEGAVIPIGFTENDVYKSVPKLFDFMYDIMYLHLMTKVEMSLYALFTGMSYRKDIDDLFIGMTAASQSMNSQATQFLLEKGVLVRPPFVSMPKQVNFVQEKNYMDGFTWFSETRSLNTVEVSLIHHAIETNLVGMQLMIGFAQVASDKEVQKYLAKGMELSKKIEIDLGEFLRQSYIEPPATHAGKATTSKAAPFSDKLMMYNTNLLASFGLGSNALGTGFCLRSDLPAKMSFNAKNIFTFAQDGGKIMIKNGWMEEPPQIEDRNQLTK
ncbi:DUF3231 family protein [Bacillus sp. ISL-40]|uniref:DUF3231 family protein n=1 Tax=unclassified Bacillus (in: firmicutes) TaxID=185979 RepID=UPI001BEC4D22|nr:MULTISPECIES: DUF3231 family protein [unclassified Bacillus (in: firmicutes)]MBT2698707.1 DUF3231 family protein [Bacillus sp. ISL-40]MBT2744689.1 DUF3231 family protein [Bacillus sp. ISL-77]